MYEYQLIKTIYYVIFGITTCELHLEKNNLICLV